MEFQFISLSVTHLKTFKVFFLQITLKYFYTMLEKMVNFKLLTLKRSDLIKKFVEFQGYLIEGLQYFIENGH